MDDIWDKDYYAFISWDIAQIKFKLIIRDNDDWINHYLNHYLTSHIINKWRSLLEGNLEAMDPKQWVVLYCNGKRTQTLLRNVLLILVPMAGNNFTVRLCEG